MLDQGATNFDEAILYAILKDRTTIVRLILQKASTYCDPKLSVVSSLCMDLAALDPLMKFADGKYQKDIVRLI